MHRKDVVRAIVVSVLVLVAFAAAAGQPSSTLFPGAAHAAASSTVFAVVGDYGTDTANEAAVANLIASWNPAFIVTVGDNFYSGAISTGDTGNKYHESVGKYYCSYLTNVAGAGTCLNGTSTINRFFPSLGNHDYSDATLATYTDYFTLPGLSVPSSNTSGNERYYDFTQGPVQFFIINSNTAETDGTNSTSIQAQWLQARLAASTATWKLVLFHHPPYSSDTTHGSTLHMQWPFAQWGTNAVLSGHAHDYERILADGIVYFVNGLGSAPIYAFGTPVPGSAFRYASGYGAQRVTATDTSLTFDFITTDGVVQDTYTITTGAATSPTPTATATDTATPTATDTPTGTLQATNTPTATPLASKTPTATPLSTNTSTATPTPTSTRTSTPTPTSTPTATSGGGMPVFSDGFESGSLAQWTSKSGLVVENSVAHGGQYAAQANTTSAAAYAQKKFSATYANSYYRIYFNRLTAASQFNLLRIRTAGGSSIGALFVAATGKLGLRNDVGSVTYNSATVVTSGWHSIELHATINGTASTTEVWLDGTRLNDLSLTTNLGNNPVGAIQLGDSATGKTYDVVYDDVVFDTQRIGP